MSVDARSAPGNIEMRFGASAAGAGGDEGTFGGIEGAFADCSVEASPGSGTCTADGSVAGGADAIFAVDGTFGGAEGNFADDAVCGALSIAVARAAWSGGKGGADTIFAVDGEAGRSDASLPDEAAGGDEGCLAAACPWSDGASGSGSEEGVGGAGGTDTPSIADADDAGGTEGAFAKGSGAAASFCGSSVASGCGAVSVSLSAMEVANNRLPERLAEHHQFRGLGPAARAAEGKLGPSVGSSIADGP
jgi:hypothetical protein